MCEIPKKLGHIWIGHLPAPIIWMDTWRNMHSNWEYTLYDNYFLKEFPFKTRVQIDEYLKRGQYAGVADLMRLEILYEFGGLIPGADSICLENTEEIFNKSCPHTVFENEYIRGHLVSPIQASPRKSDFIGEMIEELCQIRPNELDEPWISTGNLFTALMIDKLRPEIEILPSHYLIPQHFTGLNYKGEGKIYAVQLFGSTQSTYPTDYLTKIIFYLKKAQMKRYNKKQMHKIGLKKKIELEKYLN